MDLKPMALDARLASSARKTSLNVAAVELVTMDSATLSKRTISYDVAPETAVISSRFRMFVLRKPESMMRVSMTLSMVVVSVSVGDEGDGDDEEEDQHSLPSVYAIKNDVLMMLNTKSKNEKKRTGLGRHKKGKSHSKCNLDDFLPKDDILRDISNVELSMDL